jgi:hypothetical protein
MAVVHRSVMLADANGLMNSSIIADDQLAAELGRSARRQPARLRLSWRATAAIVLLIAAGFALTVLVFQPGFATEDARYVYEVSRTWEFGDWQSPVMALLWWLIDPIAPGTLSMFLLVATLYWAGFGLLAVIAARRSLAIGFATPFVVLAPPAFLFIGIIWRDVLFGAIWLIAAVLAFAVAERPAASTSGAPPWSSCRPLLRSMRWCRRSTTARCTPSGTM